MQVTRFSRPQNILSIHALTLLGILTSCAQPGVRLGADVLIEERLDLLRGKRVGLITNQSARLSNGEDLLSALERSGIVVTALFAPEHGFHVSALAGAKVDDARESTTGIRVYSLYGPTKKPTAEMLDSVDVLLYHLQDVGVRFYTYITTMGLAMEAAAEQGIPFVVLDRPNPLGGLRVEGPIVEDSLRSFVGWYPIPIVYGLTCGELALMIVGEKWLEVTATELHVIPMQGWERRMLWADTGLNWLPPSPNIPTDSTVLLYPATCFMEATNISEGRGTSHPFQLIGAPFFDAEKMKDALRGVLLPGVGVFPASFTPTTSKHQGKQCFGLRLTVRDPDTYRAVETGLTILHTLIGVYPDELRVDSSALARLLGSGNVVRHLLIQATPGDLQEGLDSGVEQFVARSKMYWLYR